MRWLLLHEVVRIKKGTSAVTRSSVPNETVSPQLLMVEMMAQTGGLLLGAETNFEQDVVFTKIEEADFDEDLKAGESIEIEATSENLRPEGAWLDGEIRGARGKIAHARFLLMNVGRLVREVTKSVTFHDEFMNHFRVRDKVE